MQPTVVKIVLMLSILGVLGILLPWGPFAYAWRVDPEEATVSHTVTLLAILGLFVGLSILFFRIFMTFFKDADEYAEEFDWKDEP